MMDSGLDYRMVLHREHEHRCCTGLGAMQTVAGLVLREGAVRNGEVDPITT